MRFTNQRIPRTGSPMGTQFPKRIRGAEGPCTRSLPGTSGPPSGTEGKGAREDRPEDVDAVQALPPRLD